MIKTVIFDMDGVLINSEPLHHLVFNSQFKKLKIEVSDELFATFTGNSTQMIFEKIIQHFDLKHDVTELVNEKTRLFVDAFHKSTAYNLISGVKDVIIDLHKNEIQLIVASSSEMEIIEAIFDRFDLNPYFSHKVSGADFPKSKPHPAIFLKAVELSGALAAECIVIEDSTNGIQAAKAAGLYCIAYKGFDVDTQNQSLADEIILDFFELNYQKISHINS